MLHKIKKIFERLLNYRKKPFGCNPFNDIKYTFKDYSFNLFFDIGANVGQSALAIKKTFPNSNVFSFEPVSSTFETLQVNTKNRRINCFPIGFGSQTSEVEIDVYENTGYSEMNSIINREKLSKTSTKQEIIKIEKLDEFCKSNSINKIDYVKIDTEGYDLEVLKGGADLLKDNKISFIEAEVSMNPENTYHVKFENVKSYLEQFDYRLYGLYDQVHEWPKSQPVLRRVNAVFVSKVVYSKSNSLINY